MFSPEEVNFINSLLDNPSNRAILLLLLVWTLAWKGIALWKAAENKQKVWFIVFLILNTLGILEIIYLFYFSTAKTIKSAKSVDGDSSIG